MSGLPTLSVSINCGSCHGAVEHDGDNYVCFDCGLMYDADPFRGEPAWFIDEQKAPCGHEPKRESWEDRRPFRTVNGVVKTWRNWVYTNQPCVLPEGHASDHEQPLEATFRDEPA